MKRLKRWTLILLVGLLLVACETSKTEGVHEEQEADVITLKVHHQFNDLGTELYDAYFDAVEIYELQNPHIKIETEIVSMDAYKKKIEIDFAGMAQNVDVFYYWAESKPKQLALVDKLLPLDEYLTAEVLAKIEPQALQSFTYDGKIYAVPTFGWYLTLYCNQELFNLAGAKIPQTFEELAIAVEKLNQLEGIIPIVVGGRDGWDASLVYQALALSELGATKLNEQFRDGNDLSEAGILKAAQNLKQLTDMQAFGQTPFALSSSEANHFFTAGLGGMRFMGSWYANQVHFQAGNRDIIATKIPINNKDFENDFVGGYVESFFVNKKTKHKEEAAKFAIYISEVIGNTSHFTGLGPSAWSSFEDPAYINPISKQIYTLFGQSNQSVIAIDTILSPSPSAIHLQSVQQLYTPDGDPDLFTQIHHDLLNK